MPRPEATPEQKAKIRNDIRTAAASLYNRDGVVGLSARSVAKEAGVSVGTIYTYFGSLQGLMESLWSGPVNRLADELRRVAETTPDPLQRIRTLLKTYVSFAHEHAMIYRGVFLFVRPKGQEVENKDPAKNATLPSLLSAAIKDGQAKGQIKKGNANDYAMMLWGGLHGCLALPNNFGRLEFTNPEKVSTGMIDLLLSGLTE